MNDYHYWTRDWSTVGLAETYNLNKIKLDLSFQRSACWPMSAKKSYIQSIFNGIHPGTLIFADVSANSHRSDYFKTLKDEGYDYVSIDGNNRSSCISEFIANKFRVKVNNKLKFYSELSTDEKSLMFNNKAFTVTIYEKIDKAGCAAVFVAHNQSEKLSAQELRNAKVGKLSDYVRNLELKLRSKVKNFKINNPKRKNDEFILDTISQQISIDATTKKHRDSVWDDSLDEFKFNTTFLEETFRLLKDVLSLDYGKRSHEALARDFILFRGIMARQKNIKAKSNAILVEAFNLERKKLWVSKKFYDIKGGEQAQYSAISGKPAEKKYYNVRIEIITDLFNSLYADGVLFNVDDRDEDTSDLVLRKKLFDHQNGICPATNVAITDFFDTQKWEVDHIKPLAKGGADDITNMQLIDKDYNRKKGAKYDEEKVYSNSSSV